jgi:hypothetical protein
LTTATDFKEKQKRIEKMKDDLFFSDIKDQFKPIEIEEKL